MINSRTPHCNFLLIYSPSTALQYRCFPQKSEAFCMANYLMGKMETIAPKLFQSSQLWKSRPTASPLNPYLLSDDAFFMEDMDIVEAVVEVADIERHFGIGSNLRMQFDSRRIEKLDFIDRMVRDVNTLFFRFFRRDHFYL